jgi:hypothetical protein
MRSDGFANRFVPVFVCNTRAKISRDDDLLPGIKLSSDVVPPVNALVVVKCLLHCCKPLYYCDY